MKRSYLSVFFLLILSSQAWSQDLGKLKDRAAQLWAERIKGDKSKASAFIETEGRGNFSMFELLKDPEITGFELTPDKTKVLVVTKGKMMALGVGEFPNTVVETWIWKNGNWYAHVEPVGNPFASKDQAAVKPQEFTFQLLDKQVDLGPHKQGETIKGSVRFTAPRSRLQVVRAGGIFGFRIGPPQWIDANNGTIEFVLDTDLIYQDIAQDIVFEAVGPPLLFDMVTSRDTLKLSGRITGTARLTQLSQTAENEKAKIVQIEIKNVSTTSFQFAAQSMDASFIVNDPGILRTVAPGETATVSVGYPGRPGLVDGDIAFKFSAGTLPKDSLSFRIKGPVVASENQQRGAPSRAEMDELVRQAIQDAERSRRQ